MDENPKLKVLSPKEYNLAVRRAQNVLIQGKQAPSAKKIMDAVDAVLMTAGVIWPAPELDPECCTSLLATHEGWQQCGEEAGHEGSHDSGDWGWADTDENVYPGDKKAEEV